jgi:Mlc titration factor MtfA (ptsG expression regulator)
MPGLRALFQRWRARRQPMTPAAWEAALAGCRSAQALSMADRARLRELSNLFLRTKAFEGAHGLDVTEAMRARIAVHACVPILNLGIDYYSNWYGIVVYPGDFRVPREYASEDGVVHTGWEELCGESQEQGPLVLSWDTLEKGSDYPDFDLVMHECAHKLDILNGPADGFPPLHAGMNVQEWTRTFTEAYARLNEQLDRGEDTGLDPYAASDPAEFFAVATETFFTLPGRLRGEAPRVYEALTRFYRQDPAQRMPD